MRWWFSKKKEPVEEVRAHCFKPILDDVRADNLMHQYLLARSREMFEEYDGGVVSDPPASQKILEDVLNRLLEVDAEKANTTEV